MREVSEKNKIEGIFSRCQICDAKLNKWALYCEDCKKKKNDNNNNVYNSKEKHYINNNIA